MNALLTNDQADVILHEMDVLGFFGVGKYADADMEHFRTSMLNVDSYFGTTFEYVNRFEGVRVHVVLSADKSHVRTVRVSNDWLDTSNTAVNAANRRIADALV